MQCFFRICFVALLFVSACGQQSLDRKLIGEWQSGCSIDICTIARLNVDHTFSVKFDEKDSSTSYSGTWRVEGDQLIAHVTAADKVLQDIVGKDFRIIVSNFQHDTFVATIADEHRTSQPWKRLH
jgi:hypothetical protein